MKSSFFVRCAAPRRERERKTETGYLLLLEKTWMRVKLGARQALHTHRPHTHTYTRICTVQAGGSVLISFFPGNEKKEGKGTEAATE